MGKCNCKADRLDIGIDNTEGIAQKIIKNIVKVFGFLLSLILLPFIMAMVIWFMFDTIVLNQNVDLGKILNYVIEKTKRFHQEPEEEDDDDDFNDLTEDDVILLDAEDITDKSD